MSSTFHVDIVSVEEQIFSGEVEYAAFPGEIGSLGVLARHAPLLTRVVPGAVRLRRPGEEDFEMIYVSGGILEIQPRMVTLLVDVAVRAKDKDEIRALEAKRQAEEARDRKENVNFALAEAELIQTIANLKLEKLKKKGNSH